ncbi:DNA polymerase III subunit alpha [Halalkalibacter urbisdiaboli]|uniref:DNA polymerase III subunit alpha n=1 Tax=Halalkalibacter urbisdiaboli TaxID=1960589 RepID=UPI000B4470B9|nr:DNA polymerase III subunit alpha [Halalkalibacter urbisdiaboli]
MEPIHTHVYSEYSLLSSTNRIEALVSRAKDLGFQALALTDKHVMYGSVPFYQACKKYGIQPILGLEVTVNHETMNETATLRLLAKNNHGYEQLLHIASLIGLKKNSELQMEELLCHITDCLVIIPYQTGPIHPFIEKNELAEALSWCKEWIRSQDRQNWLIDIQGNGSTDRIYHERLLLLAKKLEVEAVVSNPVSFLDQSDYQTYKVVQAIGRGETLSGIHKSAVERNHYLYSPEQLKTTFKHLEKPLQVTATLADICHLELRLGQPQLPTYPFLQGESADDLLKSLCFNGIRSRYEQVTPEITERLNYELRIIKEMGFSDYFLIVWDFMNYAREHDILTGPGRGSAAGSLAAYALKITDVDPIAYGLLFERFLNPERISLPDIDIDFPDHRRDEVISYVQQRYGKKHVAQIVTFGTLAARAAIRDVGKVLELESYIIDQLAKEIPTSPGMTLRKAFDKNENLQKLLKQSSAAKALFDQALKVEGLPRHASTHAAGVVISAKPLTTCVALQAGQGEIPITQAPMDVLEQLGLLKFDFLGLRNLTILERIVKMVKGYKGESLDLQQLPLDDTRTFQLLSNGDTTGVFQLESEGMRRVLKKLAPSEFEDIVAVNALYRPGPMDFIPAYISGKKGEKQIEYPHPDLEEILNKTYGVIVYQEQIMEIAAKLAGFSLAESDILRRAISKKKKSELENYKEKFVRGAVNKGYEETVAQAVFSFIERFANYGFNRSHAVAYSIISYQLAYLKVYYPEAFYSALLSSVWNNKEKVAQYLVEIKQAGIKVLPPSIKKSGALFAIENEAIRFGLLSIDQVGLKAITHIKQLQKDKPFKDLYDFCVRIDFRVVSKRAIENLIKAGAMNEFGVEPSSLLFSLDSAIAFAEKVKAFQEETEGLFTLDIDTPEYDIAEPFTIQEKLDYEQEVFGFYLSGHPIERMAPILEEYGRQKISDALREQGGVRVAGLVQSVRRIQTKKGDPMAFVQIGDETGKIDLVIFPTVWKSVHEVCLEGKLIFIKGKIDESRERIQVITEHAIAVEKVIENNQQTETLFLRIIASYDRSEILEQLKRILAEFKGDIPVVIYYEEKKQTVRLERSWYVNATSTCLETLENLLGKEHVVLKNRNDG